jgi:hypothetical protein
MIYASIGSRSFWPPHEISAEAREELEDHIKWYRSGRSWRGQGPRIEVPPEFHQMREAVAALANLVNGVGVDRVVSIFFAAELIDAPHLLPQGCSTLYTESAKQQ